MTIHQILKTSGLPVAYMRFSKKQTRPYLIYRGTGQDTLAADDTIYYSRNTYRAEYYYEKKDEKKEAALEKVLLDNGLVYTKSEDIYIESEDVYVIYYEF